MPQMNYKLLGKSGMRVSEICLGTMTFGEDWQWGADYDESKKQFDTFVNAGGNFIDTANLYTNGTSEKFCGDFIGYDREYFVLATKYTLCMNPDDPNASGNHRKNMVQAVERSLKRLNTDYIDLLWVHMWDDTTPPEEVMRALDDLVRAGKVFHVGVSDTPAWRVSQMNTMAELKNWSRFVGLQVEYSLIERGVERDLIPMANAFGMTVTPWAPLGGGVLTGKYKKVDGKIESGDAKRANLIRKNDRNIEIADKVVEIAKKNSVSPAQVAMNWCRQKSDNIIPIVGARTAEQLIDSLGCLEFRLSDDDMKALDDVSAIDLGFPHEFLERDYVRKLVFGNFEDRLER